MSKEINWEDQIMAKSSKALEAELVISFLDEEQENVPPNTGNWMKKIKEEFTPNKRLIAIKIQTFLFFGVKYI